MLRTLRQYQDLVAAARAPRAADIDGERDPLYYICDELQAQPQTRVNDAASAREEAALRAVAASGRRLAAWTGCAHGQRLAGAVLRAQETNLVVICTSRPDGAYPSRGIGLRVPASVVCLT